MNAELERPAATDAPAAAEKVEGSTIGLDEVFEVLKNQRRRHVLAYLHARSQPASLSGLAEHIAALENDKDVRHITSSERKRVYVALYQCHLPKMDAIDVVSYEKPRGAIEAGANFDAVVSYLDWSSRGNGDLWSRFKERLLARVGRYMESEGRNSDEDVERR